MMKTTILLLGYLVAMHMPAQGQKNTKYQYLNWSILIDETLHETNINRAGFTLKMVNGSTQNLNAWLYPGDVRISQTDFNKIQSPKVAKIWLWFSVNGVNIKRREYKIEMQKHWLEARFMVLKIYNLHQRKYRRMFEPTKGNKKYVHEIDLPTRQITHPRRK